MFHQHDEKTIQNESDMSFNLLSEIRLLPDFVRNMPCALPSAKQAAVASPFSRINRSCPKTTAFTLQIASLTRKITGLTHRTVAGTL
jgi:hypothetical protein